MIKLPAEDLAEIIREAEKRGHSAAVDMWNVIPDLPPLLTPGTVVRIPGLEVDYVVDRGLETEGPKATLHFTTVDGLDWAYPRTPAQEGQDGS